jgi:predicted esterase
MGDARQRNGRPWWVPVLGFLAIFAAFVWIARAPDEADSAPSAPASLPRTLAEAALVRRPADGSSDRIVLLLHGSGSSPENFLTVAEEIGRQGFVAIAVRGPRELGPARYSWSSVEETHALLGRTLELAYAELGLPRQRPLLIGYSLGATQAVRLLASHPETYASAFAIAPGPIGDDALGAIPTAALGAATTTTRPLAILVGDGDAASARAVDGIEQAWTAAHEPIWIDRHPGGHGPPGDMRKRFDSALTWMQVKASS